MSYRPTLVNKKRKRKELISRVERYIGGEPSVSTANAGVNKTVFVNEPISLDGSLSTSYNYGFRANGQSKIQWDFGYNNWNYEGGLIAPIAYPEPGVYTTTLNLYDNSDNLHTDTVQITINALTLGNETVLSDAGKAANTIALQAAIDDNVGVANKVITIPAGFISGPIVLKHRTSATYCIIRTANHVSLPNGKRRVAPSDATNMFILETINNSIIIDTVDDPTNVARYYYFIGCHLRKNPDTLAYTNAFVGLGQGDETAVNQLPNHIIFDRCYFDGGSTVSNTLRGIFIRCNDFAVVNCYFHRFKGVAIETQAILLSTGERINIMNNNLEAACENFMSGGGDHLITNHNPTDLVFRRNYCKKDLGWLSTDPSYYGTNMSVKNLFEFKTILRASVQGNKFENHWIEDQNIAIVFTPRNQDGANTWAKNSFIDFAYNIVNKIANACNIAAEDDLQAAQPQENVLIRHNIWSGVRFYNGQYLGFLCGSGQGSLPHVGFDKVAIIRNSYDGNGDPLGGQGRAVEFDEAENLTNFALLGNIIQGFINSSIAPGNKGEAALNAACSGSSWDCRKNVFYRGSGTNPTDNTTVATLAAVGYTDVANFDLSLAGGSPAIGAGLNGDDAGANITIVNTINLHTVDGLW